MVRTELGGAVGVAVGVAGLAHRRGPLASGLQAGVMVMAVVCAVVVFGRVGDVE